MEIWKINGGPPIKKTLSSSNNVKGS